MASTDELTTPQWLVSLVEPGILLAWAVSCYVKTNLAAVFQRGQILAPLLETRRLRDEAFGKFWLAFSSIREESTESAPPPPDDQTTPPKVQASPDLIPPILARASGLVLDVGPGTGTQMPLLRSPSIQAIYGAEPCRGLHAELRRRAAANGLGDKYHVLPCSIEASELNPELQKHGLTRADNGVFDTIVCVRVLCSVPNMQTTVDELYALLRPGGKLLVVEHVVNPWRTAKGSVVARAVQALYGLLGWSYFIGDCCMNRDIEKALRAAGEWESVELDRWFSRTVFPYISGVLVKKA